MGPGLIALLPLAAAQAPEEATPWYVGQPIGQVTLEALSGQLPAENLEPLLRAQQGEPYNPQTIRSDLAVLHSTGLFSDLRAEVEPGVAVGPDGEPVVGVWLSYRVIPAPELAQVRLEGASVLSRREVLLAAGLDPGDVFRVERDTAAVVERVAGHYASRGYPNASVTLSVEPVDPRRVRVVLGVDEGPPLTLQELAFAGDSPVPERQMRRILRGADLREGRPVQPQALRAARVALSDHIRGEGWLSARVNLLVQERAPAEGGGVRVLVVVDAQDRVVLQREGLPPWQQDTLWGWLALEGEGQLSPVMLPDARARVRRGLAEQGYWDARVQVALDTSVAGEQRVRVQVERGPRYRLARKGVVFEGATMLSSEELAAALAESSPEVIGRGVITEATLAAGLAALEELYRSRGWLNARLQAEPMQWKEGALRHTVRVRVQVDEGERATLTDLRVVGAAEELQAACEVLGSPLVGAPLDMDAVQSTVREVVELHRSQGYLGADARSVVRVNPDRLGAEVVVEVQSGEQVFLRNVIVRGARRTRRRVIEREVALERGDTITPDALAQTRQGLYDLGVFSVVDLSLQGEGDRLRDLVIEVDELPAWTFEVSGGVATDEGLRAIGRATRRDIWGLGHSLSALGQVGFGYSGDEWRLNTSEPEWRAGLRYSAINLPVEGQQLFLDALLNEQDQEPTFRLSRSAFGLGVQAPLGRTDFLAVEYRVQARRLEDADPGAFVSQDPWLDTLGLDDPARVNDALPSGQRWQGGLAARWITDRRDDRLNPSAGALLSVQIEVFDPLSTAFFGVRGSGQAQWLHPLGPLSLQLRGQAGLAWVAGRENTLALEDRFRLGGASTLRGYLLDSVGPKNLVANQELPLPDEISDLADYVSRGDPQRWVPTGGDSMGLLTAELRVPLPALGLDGWSGTNVVLFSDLGNVWFLNPTVLYTSKLTNPEPLLRWGVGVGLHQVTPVGPLQVDLAFNPAWFTTPWAEERGEVPLRLHLSVGTL